MTEACVVVDTPILYFYVLTELSGQAGPVVPRRLITPQFRALTPEQRAEISSLLSGARIFTTPGVIAEVDRRWRVFKPFYGTCPRCGHSDSVRTIGNVERRAFRAELHRLIGQLELQEHLVVASEITVEHFIKFGPVDGALLALALRLRRTDDVKLVTADQGLHRECGRQGIEAVHILAAIE